jgi:hypothetical protein
MEAQERWTEAPHIGLVRIDPERREEKKRQRWRWPEALLSMREIGRSRGSCSSNWLSELVTANKCPVFCTAKKRQACLSGKCEPKQFNDLVSVSNDILFRAGSLIIWAINVVDAVSSFYLRRRHPKVSGGFSGHPDKKLPWFAIHFN